ILFPTMESPLGVAVGPGLRVPTGDGQYLLGGGVVFAPRGALERPLGQFPLLGNFGVRLRKTQEVQKFIICDEIRLRFGAMYRLPDFGPISHLNAMAEMNLLSPTSQPFTLSEFADQRKSAWEILGGLRAKFAKNWGAELAVGRGLAVHPGYGREAFRAL